jgi:hypothetical protein
MKCSTPSLSLNFEPLLPLKGVFDEVLEEDVVPEQSGSEFVYSVNFEDFLTQL